MRILHLIPYFYPAWAYGGTCRAAWEVARAMARRGHAVTAYTTDALDGQGRAGPAYETVEGVEIYRFRNLSNRLAWARLFLPLTFGWRLPQAIRQADVVHLHEYRSLQAAVALPILQRLHKPFILTAQGGVPLLLGRFALKRLYDAWVGRRLLRRACRLHALNSLEQEQFLDAGGRAEQIFISPNGITVDEFRSLPDPNGFRARHHIPATAPVVLFLARIHPIKGVNFLVDAFAEMCRELPEAILVVAGPDDGCLAEVQAQVGRLGIEDRVRFIGYAAGLAKFEAYQAASLYVLPSRYEILGITLLEALACGAPVITTERCGLAETIRQNGLGSVVPYGEVTALKAEMLRWLRQGDRWSQDSQQRREYVLGNFNWETLAAHWETVYAECARSASE